MRAASVLGSVAVVLAVALLPAAAAATPEQIYDDLLQNTWQDWSWATHNLAGTTYVHGGTKAISFVPSNWEAVYLEKNGGVSGATWDSLDFWINGGTGSGQNLRIVFVLGGSTLSNRPLTDYLPGGPRLNTWDPVHVSLDTAGVGTQTFDGIYFQDGSGGTQTTVWLDDIRLTPRAGDPPSSNVAVAVDPYADRRAISPRIYGVSYATWPSLPYPVNRWGGNSTTRYNWQIDTDNKGSDWFFMNIPADNPNPGQLPNNSGADRFIDDTRAAGAEPVMTVPMIGWAAKSRAKTWGFSVLKYGAQQQTECTVTGGASWCQPDAGNGVKPGGATNVTGNDPLDTSVAINPTFVTNWLDHIAGRVGRAGAGGQKFFELDNEPMLWNSTHRDVHPVALDYAEIWQRTQDYASAMKARDPNVEIFGPVEWGWCSYFYSAKDNCGPGPDYNANGPFLEWYLAKVNTYRQSNGVRLVDWLDIHYYPQASGVALSDDESVAATRFRSLKSLYDPTYVDESWIGQPVNLIPRMKDIIARKAAPGTKLAITEYNWGNDNGLSSAIAQVEVLGIFGREGVDLAARWVAPAAGSRVEDSFRLYLDYDGAGARVEGDSVRSTSASVDQVGSYTVRRADGRLYFVLTNKTTGQIVADVTVNNGLTGTLNAWSFDGTSHWTARGTIAPTAGGFSVTLPAYSAWLVVGTAAPCNVPATPAGLRVAKSGGNLKFTWTDVAAATDYVVHEDTGAAGAFGTVTGTAAHGNPGLTVATPAGNRFYLVTGRNVCGESALR